MDYSKKRAKGPHSCQCPRTDCACPFLTFRGQICSLCQKESHTAPRNGRSMKYILEITEYEKSTMTSIGRCFVGPFDNFEAVVAEMKQRNAINIRKYVPWRVVCAIHTLLAP